ncbi:hypothetical protein [Streptomyces nigrescens]|uniref:Uncharacterized protein n=1 Tax=Streptomyces nigrescens TaxID=1920 RepID=A0ABY7JHD1_STRNI|nr:hypothetical protein [Streptomyces nigrescens]WAU09382.1 hypothetical protein STRNI_008193 [Streptomyces nigrescens]
MAVVLPGARGRRNPEWSPPGSAWPRSLRNQSAAFRAGRRRIGFIGEAQGDDGGCPLRDVRLYVGAFATYERRLSYVLEGQEVAAPQRVLVHS